MSVTWVPDITPVPDSVSALFSSDNFAYVVEKFVRKDGVELTFRFGVHCDQPISPGMGPQEVSEEVYRELCARMHQRTRQLLPIEIPNH